MFYPTLYQRPTEQVNLLVLFLVETLVLIIWVRTCDLVHSASADNQGSDKPESSLLTYKKHVYILCKLMHELKIRILVQLDSCKFVLKE